MISNDEMEDMMKIVKSLEDSGLLLKGVNETIQNEVKEQKGGFLCMLLGTLGASLLGNMLASKRFIRTATIHKIFETNSSFHVKQHNTGKAQFLFFSSFLQLLTKF